MKLTLVRFQFIDDDEAKRNNLQEGFTVGKLYIDGVLFCNTLEDVTRNKIDIAINNFFKIPSKTAIPYGTYRIILSMSNRIKKVLPEVLGVPKYTGVRIHGGNKSEDTDGCILVGKNTKYGWVSQSQVLLKELMTKLEIALKSEKVYLEITDEATWEKETAIVSKETEEKKCLLNGLLNIFRKNK